MLVNAASVQAKKANETNAEIEMAIEMAIAVGAAEAVAGVIATSAMTLFQQNALKRQSAMTIPKHAHNAKTVATVETTVPVNGVTEPNAVSAETTQMATTQRSTPKLSAPRVQSQTQQNSVTKLVLKERHVVRVDASGVKVVANVVSAATTRMAAPMAPMKTLKI